MGCQWCEQWPSEFTIAQFNGVPMLLHAHRAPDGQSGSIRPCEEYRVVRIFDPDTAAPLCPNCGEEMNGRLHGRSECNVLITTEADGPWCNACQAYHRGPRHTPVSEPPSA
jgi:hypothetical protein